MKKQRLPFPAELYIMKAELVDGHIKSEVNV